MDTKPNEWRVAIDGLWSAASLDYVQAGRLVAEIAQQKGNMALQQAAAQAVPSLRAACLEGIDRSAKHLARRRLGAVRDALHAATAPRFGKRGGADEAVTPEERHLRLLGLPSGRRPSGPEISRAYKRVAKKAHPDAGGSASAFLELSAARDALMKRG